MIITILNGDHDHFHLKNNLISYSTSISFFGWWWEKWSEKWSDINHQHNLKSHFNVIWRYIVWLDFFLFSFRLSLWLSCLCKSISKFVYMFILLYFNIFFFKSYRFHSFMKVLIWLKKFIIILKCWFYWSRYVDGYIRYMNHDWIVYFSCQNWLMEIKLLVFWY